MVGRPNWSASIDPTQTRFSLKSSIESNVAKPDVPTRCALMAIRSLGEIGLEKAILRSTGEQWYSKIGSGPSVAADTKG